MNKQLLKPHSGLKNHVLCLSLHGFKQHRRQITLSKAWEDHLSGLVMKRSVQTSQDPDSTEVSKKVMHFKKGFGIPCRVSIE
jgi:hypothetical protein